MGESYKKVEFGLLEGKNFPELSNSGLGHLRRY